MGIGSINNQFPHAEGIKGFISEAAIALAIPTLDRFEGTVLHPYLDTRGIWTIGTGNTTLLNGQPVTAHTPPITLAEADALCEQTLRLKVLPRLTSGLSNPLLDHQAAALISLVWNIGNGAFAASTVRRMLNLGRPDLAVWHFRDWCHVAGRYSQALYNRRMAETAIWNTGDTFVPPSVLSSAALVSAPVVSRTPDTTDALNAAELTATEGATT